MCQPPHPESLASLRLLQQEVEERGDECLALLLAGLNVYTSLGREWELLEIMRKFAHESEEMVRNTPSAAELRKLYEGNDADAPNQRGKDAS
jgi:hypothetical protein